jgi:hypothetical protein
MTTPVNDRSVTTGQNPNSSTATPVTPSGVGSQPTTISSAGNTDYWQTFKTGLDSFGDFVRDLVVKALDGIRSGVGFIADWIAGKSMETSSSETTNQSPWQLPPETSSQTLNAATSQDPFAALPLTDAEKQKIYKIVHTLGTSQGMTGWMYLLREKDVLEKLGQEIQHVHPLKFAEYPLKHPTLIKDVDSLSKGPFTKGPFFAGFSEKMNRLGLPSLTECESGFARSLNVKLGDIDPFFRRSDWEGLFQFLIDVKNGRKSSTWVEPVPPPASTTSTTPPPAVISTTATSTSASGGSTTILITPPPVVHLADLPFERSDEVIVTDLLNCYSSRNPYLWLIWNRSHLQLQWTHLGVRHSLKLLAYMYSKPALMAQIDTIFTSYWTKWMFMNAFTGQLARTSFAEVRLYVDEFAQFCHLDPDQTRQLIQNGQWPQLVEQLHRSHLCRAS